MPRVKLTYERDIRREGTDTLDVDQARADFLVRTRRGVVLPDRPVKQAPKKRASGRR